MHALLVFAAAAASLLPMSATAHGQTAAIVVYGTAKPQQRDVVTSTIQQTLRAASWTVPDSPFSPREHQAVVACTALDRPWPCVAATAHSKGVDHLIVIHIEPDKASKGLVLTGQVLVASDAVPSTDRGWCANCTDALLVNSAAELAGLMLQHSAARKPGSEGAKSAHVSAVQAAKPNNTAIETARAPGPTAAVPDPYGRPPDSISPSGQTSQANAMPQRTEVAPAPSYLVPALVIGAGAAAVGVGAYMSYRSDHSVDGVQSQYLYSGPGIAVAIAGGAAIGVGVYLLLRQSERLSVPEHASGPIVAPTAGGAAAGWFTNF